MEVLKVTFKESLFSRWPFATPPIHLAISDLQDQEWGILHGRHLFWYISRCTFSHSLVIRLSLYNNNLWVWSSSSATLFLLLIILCFLHGCTFGAVLFFKDTHYNFTKHAHSLFIFCWINKSTCGRTGRTKEYAWLRHFLSCFQIEYCSLNNNTKYIYNTK